MRFGTVWPGAESWQRAGDDIGVLLLHGLTGSPLSVLPWAEGLAARGRTVAAPLLPGHATSPDDLAASSWREWSAEAEQALRDLAKTSRRVFVGGLSLGGTMALDLAARFPMQVDGVIAVNAPVVAHPLARLLLPLIRRLPATIRASDDRADRSIAVCSYRRLPMRAAAQAVEYEGLVRRALGNVRCPALLFVSRQDHVVGPLDARIIREGIGSSDVDLVLLDRSYHLATVDFDRDLIVERSQDFIDKHAP